MTALASNVVLLPRGATVRYAGASTWIYKSCDSEIVAFYCASHDEEFQTRTHLSIHLKSSSEMHHLVRLCARHGCEAIPPKEET